MKTYTEEELEALSQKYESDLTKEEKRALARYKFQKQGLKGKVWYIWAYHKWTLLLILLAILAIFWVRDYAIKQNQTRILYIGVTDGGLGDTSALENEIRTALNDFDDMHTVTIDDTLSTNSSTGGTEFVHNSQLAFTEEAANQGMDILILPKTLYDAMIDEPYFKPLSDYMTEEEMASMGGSDDGYHLDITGSALAETMSLGYEPVYAAILLYSAQPENAAAYLLSLG